jgi:hypothetical protein
MPVTKRTRYEVLRRDNHTCRYCGAAAPDATLTVDHVTPVALGGTDDPSNLVAACRDCNYGKASTSPDAEMVEDVRQTDLKWADAMQRAAGALAAERERRDDYYMAFLDAWTSYGRTRTPSEAEWSLGRIYDAGFPVVEMVAAAHYAATQRGVYDRFNYFMGICWKRITQMQETAKALLALEDED